MRVADGDAQRDRGAFQPLWEERMHTGWRAANLLWTILHVSTFPNLDRSSEFRLVSAP